jgi:hypothetical protein
VTVNDTKYRAASRMVIITLEAHCYLWKADYIDIF